MERWVLGRSSSLVIFIHNKVVCQDILHLPVQISSRETPPAFDAVLGQSVGPLDVVELGLQSQVFHGRGREIGAAQPGPRGRGPGATRNG